MTITACDCGRFFTRNRPPHPHRLALCHGDFGRPHVCRSCKFRPPDTLHWSSGESSRSRAGNSATPHTGPFAARRCCFCPPAALCWSSGGSSCSHAGDAAASHTVPLAGGCRRFHSPAASRWFSRKSARGRTTAATTLHAAPLEQWLFWRTATSLRRLLPWHTVASLQWPLLSPFSS